MMHPDGHPDAETMVLLLEWVSTRINRGLVEAAVDEFFDLRNTLAFDREEAASSIAEGCGRISDGGFDPTSPSLLRKGMDPCETALGLYIGLCEEACSETLHQAVSLGRWDVVSDIASTILSAPSRTDCGLVRWMMPEFHMFVHHVDGCIRDGRPEDMFGYGAS